MDTTQIRRLIQSDTRARDMLGGVLPCDLLPQTRLKNKTLFVINKDPKHLPGSHWVAAYIEPERKNCVFFDSYGQKPNNRYINNFLKMNAFSCEYNVDNLQGPCSNVCGLYCLFFCYHISRGRSLNQIVQHFNIRTKSLNDKKVAKFVRHIYKHSLPHVRTDYLCYTQTSKPQNESSKNN
jgi:hypothetical protein